MTATPDAPTPRPAVVQAEAAYHGAFDYAELEALGVQADALLDFSVNSNPYGPSPAVRAALAAVPPERYPDRECLALRRSLSARLGLGVEQIVVGNGTAELLLLIALAYLRPATAAASDAVVIVEPTFGEYRRVSALLGAEVQAWRAEARDGFQVDAAAVAECLVRARPRLAFLCNPNNPTGVATPPDAIARWCAACPATLFIIDEAYLGFSEGRPSALALEAPNLVVLRSMTKDYALAGLRLGYAAGPAAIVGAIAAVRPAWNVNALAQAAGLAALADAAHQQDSLRHLRAAAAALWGQLRALGLAPLPSAVHYALVPVGNGAALRRALLAKGIMVRDCASFGLPGYVRIAARRPEENARLVQALREVLPGFRQP